MPPPTRITLWDAVTHVGGALVVATALTIGIPLAAIRFDDPSRLAWLLVVPVVVGIAVWAMVKEPYRVVVSDSGIEVKWVGRSRRFERTDLLEMVATRRTTLMGEGVAIRMKPGRTLDLPNDHDRVFGVLQAHFPEVPSRRSDSGYLSA